MDKTLDIANKIELKELELNSLLEITQAINENVAEESLYKIYNFILRANLSLKKLLLLVYEQEQWVCKIQFGTTNNYEDSQPFIGQKLKETTVSKEQLADSTFKEFEAGILVYHKEQLLAVVYLGGNPESDNSKNIHNHLNFIQALTNIMIVAIENKKMARERLEKELFDKELEIAKKVQQLLFPKTLPESDKFKINAHYSPHSTVGGDYYDWNEIDEFKKMVCIADVSGKGVPAALLMSNFQATLRTLMRQTSDLEKIIRELNHQVFQSVNGENFITFFIAIIDSKNGKIEYVNAGHNPPYLIFDGQVKELTTGTLVLGAFADLPFLEIGEEPLHDQQMLFLYTDGLTEAFDINEEEFGPERLKLFLEYQVYDDPEILVNKILDSVDNFVGSRPLMDDITLLACSFSG